MFSDASMYRLLSGSRITLLVSGSIAAYKSAELIRALRKAGAQVRVAMTKSATEFISPLTLQTLSGVPIRPDLFDVSQEAEIGHIELADEADLVLVAPASANLIAKAAQGLADDLASTILLATTAPVLMVPAMNVNMWRHPATQANVATLRSRKISVMDPDDGELACGWVGAGRFPELPEILDAVDSQLHPKDMGAYSVVVTAGPTREPIDPIRFLSNRSSGRMGFAIARQAFFRGAAVHLIAGPTQLAVPREIRYTAVETAEQMAHAVFSAVREDSSNAAIQLLCMAAAVSDHRPVETSSNKIKRDKTESYHIEVEPCQDILKTLGEQREELEAASARRIVVIGFAAETAESDRELIALTRDKLKRKSADMILGNRAEAMGKDHNRLWLIDSAGRQEEVATANKVHIADSILNAAMRL